MRNVACGLGTFVLKRQSVASKHTLRMSFEIKAYNLYANNETNTQICNKIKLNNVKCHTTVLLSFSNFY